MKSHAWRPLLVVFALVALILAVRYFYVPSDFGVHERGYTYGWYRERNVWDWQKLTNKYQGKETCFRCHAKQAESISFMPHAIIQCENCHGPALNHPTDPEKLPIDTSRELCLRCHAKLPYPGSARGELRGIDPATHNPGRPCVECHSPHEPRLENLPSPALARRHESEYCRSCHREQVDTVKGMPHEIIYCESCHGKARNHPSDPEKLSIDTTRKLCLQCHVDKVRHNVDHACVTCHDPHMSSLQNLQFLP